MSKGDRGGVHKQLKNGKPLKAMRKWFKAGKPKDKFDSTIYMDGSGYVDLSN